MDPLKDPPETQRRPHLKVRLKLNEGPVETVEGQKPSRNVRLKLNESPAKGSA